MIQTGDQYDRGDGDLWQYQGRVYVNYMYMYQIEWLSDSEVEVYEEDEFHSLVSKSELCLPDQQGS